MDHLVFIKPVQERPGRPLENHGKLMESIDYQLVRLTCMSLREYAPSGKTGIYAFNHAIGSARVAAEQLGALMVTEQSRRFESLTAAQIGNIISDLFTKEHGKILGSFSTLILMASNNNMSDIVQQYVGQSPVITGAIPLLQPGQAVVYQPGKRQYRVLW